MEIVITYPGILVLILFENNIVSAELNKKDCETFDKVFIFFLFEIFLCLSFL